MYRDHSGLHTDVERGSADGRLVKTNSGSAQILDHSRRSPLVSYIAPRRNEHGMGWAAVPS